MSGLFLAILGTLWDVIKLPALLFGKFWGTVFYIIFFIVFLLRLRRRSR